MAATRAMSRERNTKTFRALVGLATGIIVVGIIATAVTIWAWRRDTTAAAIRDIGNTATVLAEQTSRSVQSMDLVLSDLQDKLRAMGATTPESFRQVSATKDVYGILVDRLQRLSQATVIALIDSSGRILNSTRSWPPPERNLADRRFFQHAKGSRDRNLFVTGPVVSTFSDIPTIYWSRRIEGPDGEFLGAIIAGSEVSYFRHVYDSIQALQGQSFTLLRDDGTVLVHHPDNNKFSVEMMPIDSPWYGVVSQGGGAYRSTGIFNGQPRLIAVRPLREYPLVVDVSVSEAQVLASWWWRAVFIAAGTLLMVICSALLLKALSNQFKQLSESEASLAERETTLAEKSNQLEIAHMQIDAALNNITQGLVMFDREARIVVTNERYIEMYGLSRDIVKPGCTLQTLIQHRKDVGLFKGDPDQYCRQILRTIAAGKTAGHLIETTDGRTVYAVEQPLADGGWVVTHDDITERKRAEEQMAFMARHDALTGLANRTLLREKMEEALARLRRRGEMFTLFVLDLDLFKSVNDSLGHPIGDLLLAAVGRRLRASIRETDTVARLGGDEFALLQTVDGNQRAAAIALADRLLEAVNVPYEIEGNQIMIGTSIGIVLAPDDGMEVEQLLKNADLALYRAKAEGRNAYRLFATEMDAEARSRHSLQNDLRASIGRDEFEILYQTAFDATTGQARRRGGVGPLVPPGTRDRRTGSIHPDRRGDRADRAARGTGAATRLHGCNNLAAARQSRRQSVGAAIPRRQTAGNGQLRVGGFRPCARTARARDHRIGAAAKERGQSGNAARVQEPRHLDRARRFRDWVFVAQLPALVPVRQDQDRQVVRERIDRAGRMCRDRRRRHRAWTRPQHSDDGGRGGNRGAILLAAGIGSRPGTRISVQSPVHGV